METVGERIYRLRKEQGLSCQELAKRIGVSYTSVSHYEHDKRIPSRITAEALCDIFNVDMDYLYCKTEIKRATDLTGAFDNHINSEEIAMILAFRNAPANIQQSIKLMLGVES